MRKMTRWSTLAASVAGLVLSAVVPSAPAHAYGGDGAMDVYQLGISFNCNNPSF
jgi:hypothetical protein